MPEFYLQQTGRMPAAMEAKGKADAMAQLRYIVAEEAKRCRTRYGKATVHKLSATAYSVTIGRDRQASPLWTTVSLAVIG